MNMTYNHDLFEKFQDKVIREIAGSIKRQLEENNIDVKVAQEITADTTFEIAAIIDGCRIMDVDGEPVEPILTFRTSEDVLLWDNGSSWMHEVVYGWVYDLFPRHLDSESGNTS